LSLLSLHYSIPLLSSACFRSQFNHLYSFANFYSAVRDHGRGFEHGRFHTDCNGEDRRQGACSSYRQHGSLHLKEGDILTNNPWVCTSYEQAGVTLPGVSKAFES